MADEEKTGSDIAVEVAGQKFNFRNVKSLNTVATVVTLVIVCLVAYELWVHQQDGREMTKEFSSAVKEQTVVLKEQATVAREQNCLIRFDTSERQKQADFCRQIAR